jgi:hypothetical protein
MPELPDVEGFRAVLAGARGHRITRVDVADPGVGQAERHTATVKIPPGGLLCYFTDGLIKQPGELLDDSWPGRVRQ